MPDFFSNVSFRFQVKQTKTLGLQHECSPTLQRGQATDAIGVEAYGFSQHLRLVLDCIQKGKLHMRIDGS